MAESRFVARKLQEESRTSCANRQDSGQKKDGNMSKDTEAIVKGFPTAKCGTIIKIKNENTH